MREYRLVTTWQFEAPLKTVYGAVCDPLRWPQWWPDVRHVEQRRAGDARGEGQWLRCTWQGRLPYRLSFDIVTTRIRPPVLVEGTVSGDLAGFGRCRFSQEGTITTVRHEWRVHATRRWLTLLAPFAAPLFKFNHAQAMRRAGERLARRLDTPAPSMTHIDLDADCHRQSGRLAAAGAGLVAGGLATALQAALWWAAGLPVAATFERDVRLTAAIALGPPALATPANGEALLFATLIHLLLSAAYGLALAPWLARLPPARALAAGALFGAALYGINLYAFTALFPWFAEARDWITFATHIAFGLLLAGGWLALRNRRSGTSGGDRGDLGPPPYPTGPNPAGLDTGTGEGGTPAAHQ